MDFYLDENLPKRVAKALNELEGENAIHKVFSTELVWGKGVKDKELFHLLHKVNGILITNDARITTRKSEFALVKELKLSVFVISFRKGSAYWEKALRIINTWNLVKTHIEKHTPNPIVVRIIHTDTCLFL